MQAHSQFLNPYYNCDAVRDFSMFFGREHELRILYQAIAKHQSVSIVGLRHIGKSSLLKFLSQPELQQANEVDLRNHIFILTDWREYLNKDREDFFSAVCEQIITQSKHMLTLKAPPFIGEDKFRKLLEDIKDEGFHPVLLMDAFDRVTSNPQFDPRFFSFLRSLAGVNDLISYITATIKPLHKVCHSDIVAQSPFFNIFLTCPLGPLMHDEAYKLIITPTRQTLYAFTPEEVSWLVKQAGMHPFFLQMACRHLFDTKHRFQSSNAKVDLQQVEMALYQELLPHFDQIWGDLEEDQKARLKIQVFHATRSTTQFLELSESLLFRKRIRNMFQDSLTQISIKDIKDALDHLDETDFLTHCKLGELQSISLHVESSGSPSSAQRGVLVRNLLRSAFERMKPDGARNDADLEWRLYNILWYHYFKYHLPNPNTAARLGIGSLRQFYREQDKAIQALLKEVLDLEAKTLNAIE